MDAEMFSTWLDGVGSLTRDQRRKAFMVVALREADDDSDWTASDAADEAAMPEAPAVIATTLGDEVRNRAVPPGLPMSADGKVAALAGAAWKRVAVRTATRKTCGHGGAPTGCRAIVARIADGLSTP